MIRRSDFLLIFVVAALFIPSVPHSSKKIETWRHITPRDGTFFDFRIFNSTTLGALKGDPLYRTDKPHFFRPGSLVYKYPPPYAALLSFGATNRWKSFAQRWLLFDVALIFLSVGLMSRAERAPPLRVFLIFLLAWSWKPFWESCAGIQLEPIILFFLSLGVFAAKRGHTWLLGAGLGVSAALKVYPLLLGPLLLLQQRARSIGAAVASLALTLVFGAVRMGWAETSTYFLEVLPRLGGTSLQRENLGGMGQLGSIVVSGYQQYMGATGGEEGVTLEALGSPVEVWTVRIIIASISLAMALSAFRLVSTRVDEGRRLVVSVCLAVPILLFSMPTSWLDYQCLLFLPVGWLFLHLPLERRHGIPWIVLFLFSLSAFLFDTDNPSYAAGTPAAISLVRTLVPLGVWAATMLAVGQQVFDSAGQQRGPQGGAPRLDDRT